ncbi:MAG: tetratricopeptide repeat protein [Thermoguttaceae bacterium]
MDPVYPLWRIQASNPLWWLPLLAMLGMTAVLWRYRTSWSRPFLFAWGFFCVALFPVMGFTDVGFMRFSLVADRYQHVAIIGVIALVTAGLITWQRRVRNKKCWAMVVLAAGIPAFLSWGQSGIYRDPITFNRAALEKNPAFWLGYYNLGVALNKEGHSLEAAKQYEQVLRLEPNDSFAHSNLAAILIQSSRYQEAIDHLRQALRVNPDYLVALNNMAGALVQTGRPEEAIQYCRQALRLKPDCFEAHYNLANAFFNTGRFQEAIEQYDQAIRLESDRPKAHYNMGVALINTGRLREAIDHFEKVLRLRPDFTEAHNNLAIALLKTGRPQEAIEHYQKVLRLKPDSPEIHFNLALAYANMRQSSKAFAEAQKAVELAQSQGNSPLVKQIEDWLNSYHASLSKIPSTPPISK